METEKRELWDRLNNESERAHRAFQTFLSLPSNNRTVIGAYRSHVGNPTAHKVSDTWAKWSCDFAWAERASAYDAYLESLRREAYERVIEEEAERQAREVEKARYRSNELLTLGYERAMEWLEDAERSDIRFNDVLNLTRLYMDYLKTFDTKPESRDEDDWEEDDTEFEEIIKEIEAESDPEDATDDSEENEGEQD
jgi:hypothetical protein